LEEMGGTVIPKFLMLRLGPVHGCCEKYGKPCCTKGRKCL
jgi:hypothetical protein